MLRQGQAQLDQQRWLLADTLKAVNGAQWSAECFCFAGPGVGTHSDTDGFAPARDIMILSLRPKVLADLCQGALGIVAWGDV